MNQDLAKKILIVEDQKANRTIIRKILQDVYEVCEASNGEEAIDLLKKDPSIAAVLLDIPMPVTNDHGILYYLKTQRNNNIPLIVMTAKNDVTQEVTALNNGAWDFVVKPIQPEILLTRLRNAIARSESELSLRLKYAAEHDPLTGLYNRCKLYQTTREMLDAHPNITFVFLRFDIDRFSIYNTDYGEAEGDKLICFISDCLRKMANHLSLCTYGRIDADVFCLCQPYDRQQLDRQIESTRNGLANYRKNCLLKPTFGAYVINDPSLSIEHIYVRAAMGSKLCKNRFETYLSFYSEEHGERVRREATIINEMQTALEQRQFVIYFQPKFDLSSEQACGGEALVRWQHPTAGLIPPSDFIPIFERNGFIAKLDYYVWEQVCLYLQSWMAKGYYVHPISVNVSRISMYDPELTERLTALLDRYNVPIDLFQLEITESAYMSNPTLMQTTIEHLRQAGFVIMMDDFGCGYSSLNTLKEINVDVLKIDMNFLTVEGDRKKAKIILASIIRMASWLGLTVVVEGVETQVQKEFLLGIGCHYVQGYYYARPMPEPLFEQHYVSQQNGLAVHTTAIGNYRSTPKGAILIIDNEDDQRAALCDYFEADYQIYCCNNVEDGMACLKANAMKIQIIFIGNRLPGLSSLDFLEYYHGDPIVSTIPKIIIVDIGSVDDLTQAFQLGVQEFIMRPFNREVVLFRVNRILEIQKQLQSYIAMESEYKSMMAQDKATQLMNKNSFIDHCTDILKRPTDKTHALLILDIDDFKQINDVFGHLAGDNVIKAVAQEMIDNFRGQDVLGRFGGDEFVILMANIMRPDVVKGKAIDLMRTVSFTCAQELRINVSISVGIAFFGEGDTFDTLFSRADQALYEAKRSGKAKFSIYGESVPPIIDDNKPIVLICGEDPQLYPSIGLSYGDSAAFANITTYEELVQAFEKYHHRIRAICMDSKKRVMPDSDAFYQYILEHGGGTDIPILAIYQDGDLEQAKHALSLNIKDLISLPPQSDLIRRKLSHWIVWSELQHGSCTVTYNSSANDTGEGE